MSLNFFVLIWFFMTIRSLDIHECKHVKLTTRAPGSRYPEEGSLKYSFLESLPISYQNIELWCPLFIIIAYIRPLMYMDLFSSKDIVTCDISNPIRDILSLRMFIQLKWCGSIFTTNMLAIPLDNYSMATECHGH